MEAEWEKAARGLTINNFPWGDKDANCNFANFGGIGGCVGDTSEVGSYLDGRSQYGVMDMAAKVPVISRRFLQF